MGARLFGRAHGRGGYGPRPGHQRRATAGRALLGGGAYGRSGRSGPGRHAGRARLVAVARQRPRPRRRRGGDRLAGSPSHLGGDRLPDAAAGPDPARGRRRERPRGAAQVPPPLPLLRPPDPPGPRRPAHALPDPVRATVDRPGLGPARTSRHPIRVARPLPAIPDQSGDRRPSRAALLGRVAALRLGPRPGLRRRSSGGLARRTRSVRASDSGWWDDSVRRVRAHEDPAPGRPGAAGRRRGASLGESGGRPDLAPRGTRVPPADAPSGTWPRAPVPPVSARDGVGRYPARIPLSLLWGPTAAGSGSPTAAVGRTGAGDLSSHPVRAATFGSPGAGNVANCGLPRVFEGRPTLATVGAPGMRGSARHHHRSAERSGGRPGTPVRDRP
jgi:hypothetical protein